MAIAVTEDHEALRLTAHRWTQTHCPPEVPRAVAEAAGTEAGTGTGTGTGTGDNGTAAVWEKMAAQGWLGLHVPEADGGQGFALAELAVVLEELGAALMPGPVLPTLVASAALARHPDAGVRSRLLPGLADGSVTAALSVGGSPLSCDTAGDGTVTISGGVRPVLGELDAAARAGAGGGRHRYRRRAIPAHRPPGRRDRRAAGAVDTPCARRHAHAVRGDAARWRPHGAPDRAGLGAGGPGAFAGSCARRGRERGTGPLVP